MGLFSGSKQAVALELDTGVSAFLKPICAGQGQSLAKFVEALVYREVGAMAAKSLDNARRFTHSERAVLLALLGQIAQPRTTLDIGGVPWLSRAWFAQRLGLSKVSIMHATNKLIESGDLISRTAEPEKGRHGIAPILYSFTPKGAQTAFHLESETEESLFAISSWEDRIGYPGKGEKGPSEPAAVDRRDLETSATCAACEEPDAGYEHAAGCANG